MKKHSLAIWMLLMAIPVVNIFGAIALWLVVYQDILTLKPDTSRTLGKDILIGIATLSLFWIAVPFLAMEEIQDGARRVGVKVANTVGWYYVLCIVIVIALVAAGAGEVPNYVVCFVSAVTGPLMALSILWPFNQVAKRFEDAELAS